VVTIPGGGWVAADPSQMDRLAALLVDEGIVVASTTYRAMGAGGRFPGMVEEVACAIAEAAQVAGSLTTTPDRIFVVAHSAGAQLAALAVMAPDVFGCPGVPMPAISGFIGLAGAYDVTRIALLSTLFGVRLEDDPELWASGNPRSYLDTAEPFPTLLVHGDADAVVPLSFSSDLEDEMVKAGWPVELLVVPGAGHSEMRDPAVVGTAIEAFVASAP
jgi:acetyl esterase/lipase